MNILAEFINPQLFLLDTFLLAIAALFIGLIYYHFTNKQKEATTVGWQRVETSVFKPYDLVVALLFVAFFSLNVVLPVFLGEETLGKLKQNEMTENAKAINILITSVIQFGLPCALIWGLLVFREAPQKIFGLDLSETKQRPHNIIILSLVAGGGAWFSLGLILYGLNYPELIKSIFGENDQQEVVKAFAEAKSIFLKATMTLLACIVAPVCEEFIFRGYFYPALKKYTSFGFAITLNCLIFAVIHGNALALLPLFLLSIVIVLSYEITKSLWAPISIHLAFNTLTTAMIFLQPYLPQPPQ